MDAYAFVDNQTPVTVGSDDNFWYSTQNTIDFKYVIGAHLKSKYLGSDTDDDGNVHYYYDEFEYDENDNHGVLYTESYIYEPRGEIDELNDTNFKKYVTPNRRVDDTYRKCEFSTFENTNTLDTEINGISVNSNYIVGTYSYEFSDELDVLCNPVTKFDYFTGMPYSPTVENDVRINRGNAAAWERHFKLGEVRSLEDMETYANNGFFNLRNNVAF
jgi:hypothetical protein